VENVRSKYGSDNFQACSRVIATNILPGFLILLETEFYRLPMLAMNSENGILSVCSQDYFFIRYTDFPFSF